MQPTSAPNTAKHNQLISVPESLFACSEWKSTTTTRQLVWCLTHTQTISLTHSKLNPFTVHEAKALFILNLFLGEMKFLGIAPRGTHTHTVSALMWRRQRKGKDKRRKRKNLPCSFMTAGLFIRLLLAVCGAADGAGGRLWADDDAARTAALGSSPTS